MSSLITFTLHDWLKERDVDTQESNWDETVDDIQELLTRNKCYPHASRDEVRDIAYVADEALREGFAGAFMPGFFELSMVVTRG